MYTFKAIASYSDSGTYKLEVKQAECLEAKGTVQIKVIPPPTAPCSVTNNTSTSSVVGVGGDTYSSVSFSNNIVTAYPAGSISNGALRFRFWGNVPPKPGKYKTNGGTFSDVEKEVACWIGYFPATDFICKVGQDVYVTMVNGKMQVSFCSCGFTNPLGSSIITISAKVTQP
jgi:hypothetical protein